MSDKLVEAIDRLEKTIADLKGTVTELVGDMQVVRMKQAMMADRIRKVSIRVKDYAQPQDQHGPSIPAQDMPIVGAREVQRKLEETFSGHGQSSSMSMPRCTDCEYSYRKPFSPWTCIHPSIAATDPVTGQVLPAACFRARLTDGPCGPNGKGFRKKT
jgi:hypothetical protein